MTRVLTIAVLLGAVVPALTAEPMLTHVDVFTSGREGYPRYRIPAITTAPDGTLLAFCEARKGRGGDPGFNEIDLVYKTSDDRGRTWNQLVVLEERTEGRSVGNPCLTVDGKNKRVWLLYNRCEPGATTFATKPGVKDVTVWARYSDDNGHSWSEAIELWDQLVEPDWGSLHLGPGSGIQSSAGRLLFPACVKPGGGRDIAATMHSLVLFSDDHGKTWAHGDLVEPFTNENELVELTDGRILMSARQNRGPRRFVIFSTDGGETWSKTASGQPVTRCACAVERFTSKANGGDRNRILWTGPKGPGRKTLVVKVSYDEGETFPVERIVSRDDAAYSDMTTLGDTTAAVLWERGGYQHITFSRFNRAFLEPPTSEKE